MANEMIRVEKFEKMIEEVDYFISDPTSFLYDHIEDPDIYEIVECTRAIALNNYLYIKQKRENIEQLNRTISQSQDIIETAEEETIEQHHEEHSNKVQKDLTELLDLIIYSCLDDVKKILDNVSSDDFKRLKLEIYRLIIDTKRQIKMTILTNPTANISSIQDNLHVYELILETMKEMEERKKSLSQETSTQEYSNIIIAPTPKKSTYLYEDILEYSERTREIKLIFEKIVDGYFLKTKDTKPIEGYQENLYEYKYPNGIRILYIVSGNVITICSLFMKDKQKSTRITNEYEEAIRRYYASKEYILDNFTNPDFHIEQAELVGAIFSLLDGNVLSKKVGE